MNMTKQIEHSGAYWCCIMIDYQEVNVHPTHISSAASVFDSHPDHENRANRNLFPSVLGASQVQQGRPLAANPNKES